MYGEIEIPGLLVDSECDISITSLPDGVLPDGGIFDTRIGPRGNLVLLYFLTDHEN